MWSGTGAYENCLLRGASRMCHTHLRKSQHGCGRGEPNLGGDFVAGIIQAAVRSARGEPSPGAEAPGKSRRRCGCDMGPVPAQMWLQWAQSRRRCGCNGPSPGADVAAMGPVPAHLRIAHSGMVALGPSSPTEVWSSSDSGCEACGSAANRPDRSTTAAVPADCPPHPPRPPRYVATRR
jgi:hypothetical protein